MSEKGIVHNDLTLPPKHIAYIVDGNRRWAQSHGKTPTDGHIKGADNIETIINATLEKDIKLISFWLLSPDNIKKRNSVELQNLFEIIETKILGELAAKLIKDGIHVAVAGDKKDLPKTLKRKIKKINSDHTNRQNSKARVTFGINYGGREEIVYAVKRLKRNPFRRVTEEAISKRLYNGAQPDPDIIVRTGGDLRLSGYQIWQSKNSEIVLFDNCWPDLTPSHIDQVLADFSVRHRGSGA